MDRQLKALADRPEPSELSVPEGCSYPENYELSVNLRAVGRITVRPIRREDSPILEHFFASLTPKTIYLRFFCFMKQLSPSMLDRLTRIDYEREIALAAFRIDNAKPLLLGDARVIQTAKPDSAEFSVLISDPWQGKGIGALLLRHCLAIARQRGFKHIYGIVLAENRRMLALGKRLDFTIKHITGAPEYELFKTFE